MVNPIPESVRKIWDEWNIRGVILSSLCLQVILTLFAPLRKGTTNKLVIMLLWSVYLLADLAAVFALGLISNTKADTHTPAVNTTLIAFWPPFLMLHLGGPDNITAFALEDNELWLRHFVGLLVQAVAAVYIFLLSLPETRLTVPTVLMFVAASIKYLERTRAFYLSSFDGFQNSISKEPNPGFVFDEAKRQREISQSKFRVGFLVSQAASVFTAENEAEQTRESHGPKKTREHIVLRDAYHYLKIFKGLIVDLVFSFRQRLESQYFFWKLSPEAAYRIIEVELNFIYEILYTKVQVVFSPVGCIRRFISFGLVVAAFAVFHFKVKKHGFDEFDIAITYTLFLGAIALDIIALFILISFDLTLGALADRNSKFLCKMLDLILNLKKPRWYACDNHSIEHRHEVLSTPFLFGRWSGHVSGYNLLRYFLKKHPTRVHKVKNCPHNWIEKIIHSLGVGYLIQKLAIVFIKVSHLAYIHKLLHFLGSINDIVISCFSLADFLDGIRFVSREPLTKEVWEFIFNELRTKSHLAVYPEAAMKISSARGESILQERDYCSSLLPYVSEVTYDESILVWHLATELLYQSDHEVSSDNYRDREISKVLSDYMLYLLIIQPSVMSTVTGIAKIRFQDTCAQTREFLRSKNLKIKQEKELCEEILALNVCEYMDPEKGKLIEDGSMSVLVHACILANELKKLDDFEEGKKEDKWKLMSKIWVEMLSYAASSSGSRVHTQQVNRGGELITFVWLLMAHFGLQRQFQR